LARFRSDTAGITPSTWLIMYWFTRVQRPDRRRASLRMRERKRAAEAFFLCERRRRQRISKRHARAARRGARTLLSWNCRIGLRADARSGDRDRRRPGGSRRRCPPRRRVAGTSRCDAPS
jgi:hypothetical protein